MSRDLFLTIIRGVREYNPYFGCMPNVTGKFGFTSYQKRFTTVGMLVYGVASDLLDEICE
jgi:phosphoribosylformylglycinamidine (FGAM) synthase-like enzyme